jgi:hypothetical protein
MMRDDLDLLGLWEVAELLDVEPTRISRWRHKGIVLRDGTRVPLPEPVHTVRATPLWCGRDIRPLRDRIRRRSSA